MINSYFHLAYLGPGGPEFMIVMLVLLVMFGAKDAPRILRKLNDIFNQVRNTADSFKREVMYGDLNQSTPSYNSSDTMDEDEHDEYDDDYDHDEYGESEDWMDDLEDVTVESGSEADKQSDDQSDEQPVGKVAEESEKKMQEVESSDEVQAEGKNRDA